MRIGIIVLGFAATIVSACNQGPHPAAPGAVGSACRSDTDCASGLTCFTSTPSGNVWAGGYCTRPCDSETCPSGSRCSAFYTDANHAAVTLCASTCARVSGSRDVCRDGYACSYDGVCLSGCAQDADCTAAASNGVCEVASGRCLNPSTTGSGGGGTCSTDPDCRGPQAFCDGGACLRLACDLGGEYACDAGQICVGFPIAFDVASAICTMPCTPGVDALSVTNHGVCPAGWLCLPGRADVRDVATSGFCFPTDYADPFVGSTTAQVGDPCSTFADCPNPFGYGVCSHPPGATTGHCSIVYCAAPTIASMNICGANSECLTFASDPSRDRFTNAGAELGGCFRHCDASGACPSGLECAGTDHTCVVAHP